MLVQKACVSMDALDLAHAQYIDGIFQMIRDSRAEI